MNNKIGFVSIIAIIALLSGCTQTTDNTNSTNPGTLSFNYNINPLTVRQGDLSIITLELKNQYSNALENIQIRFEPIFSGINFVIDGPLRIEPKGTGLWTIEMQTSNSAIPKGYIFRPIICFDYSQTKRGYFLAASNAPSFSEVDYSTSDSGPLNIVFDRLRGINALKDSNKIDTTVRYSFANNYNGLTNNTSALNQLIKEGIFELYSDNYLRLKASSGANKLKNLGEDNYCTLINKTSTCQLNELATITLEQPFTFIIEVSKPLISELETNFLNTINYTICLKSINDFKIEVEKLI
jgi:hypothetical protein